MQSQRFARAILGPHSGHLRRFCGPLQICGRTHPPYRWLRASCRLTFPLWYVNVHEHLGEAKAGVTGMEVNRPWASMIVLTGVPMSMEGDEYRGRAQSLE